MLLRVVGAGLLDAMPSQLLQLKGVVEKERGDADFIGWNSSKM